MPVQRIHRLIRLITLLQSRRPRSADELAAELGVSRRTLFRDLNALQQAGVPYFHESDVGYRIAQSYYLPPVSLTVVETLGLLTMTRLAESQRRKPMFDAALSAINKLIATVPAPIRSACEDLTAQVSFRPAPQTTGDAESRRYGQLQQAVDERRVCRIAYASPVEPDPPTLEVHPYALHYSSRAWYLFAHSPHHGMVRVFKLVRIARLEVADEKFLRPVGWSIADKLGNAWELNPGEGTWDVAVRFSPRVATNVAEVRWHSSQQHEPLPDGGCQLRFRVDGLHEIAWWICGYADQAQVQSPPELRQIVSEMLRRAAAQYADRKR